MMVFQAKLAVLLALLVLAACNADDGTIPPCTPADGSGANLCEQDISQIMVGDSRGSGPSMGGRNPQANPMVPRQP